MTTDLPIRPGFWNVPLWGEIGVYFVGIAAVAYMIYGFYKAWQHHKSKAQPNRHPVTVEKILRAMFDHRKMMETTNGKIHTALVIGFFFLFLGTALATLDWDIGHYIVGEQFLRGNIYLAYKLILDIAGIAVLVALALAALRRRQNPKARQDQKFYLAYASLAVVVITGYFVEALRLAIQAPAWVSFSPVGNALAQLFLACGLNPETAPTWHTVIWTTHGLLSLGFIAAIPYTFYSHLYRTPAAQVWRKEEPKGTINPIADIEEQESFGLIRPSQLTFERRISLDGCTECGRCDNVCPALASGAPLSPRDLVGSLRAHMDDATDPTLPGEIISKETLWACTTCGACERACPANISIPELIVDMRRHLALEQGEFPEGVANTLGNVTDVGNPWGLDPYERTDWTEGLDVHIAEEGEHYDLLYWVGCAASYDRRARKIARAMVQILNASGLRYAILREERCHGEFGRRMGEEYLYQTAALENIENFKLYSFDRIVAACPHCFHTLKNEYPALEGGKFNVISHSELILECLDRGLLTLKADKQSLTYHDPCYLARLNQQAGFPREILKRLGADLTEVENHGEETFCCGAGGGQMWSETRAPKAINIIRLEALKQTGQKRIAAACPHCITMLDSARAELKDKETEIFDIAELVAKQLATKTDPA